MRAVAITDDWGIAPVEVEPAPLKQGEVRVDVSYCGICGSDLHVLNDMRFIAAPGHIFGHEFSGTVSEIGKDVEGDWAVGNRVVILPMEPCNDCYPCSIGQYNMCEHGIMEGVGIGRPGGYAESANVPACTLHRLPDSVSDAHAALTEPLAVAIRGVELAELTSEDSVCVLGAGPIGVMAALGLRARGHDRVGVVEVNQHRREQMEKLGFPTASPEAAVDRIPEVLGGAPKGVIDCTGHVSGIPLAAELLPAAGKLMVVGATNEPVPLSIMAFMPKEIVIRFSYAYVQRDFAESLDHIAAGRIPCDEVITTIAALEEAPSWFDDLGSGATEQLKVLLRP